MSLYLSRICLNPLYAPAIKLAADAQALHSRLYALFQKENPSGARSLLFRIDTEDEGPIVLLQSTSVPDWDALELAPRSLREQPATKPYDPAFAMGQRLSFRLLARPSIRKSGHFGSKPNGKRKPGPRQTCRDDRQRLAWLKRKGADSGFQIESVGLTILSFPAIKSEKSPRERGGSFSAVQFDGVLVVTDPDKLKEAVRNGIGPQKAYGFGLLSLAPLRE